MMEKGAFERYKIVFRGELVANMSREEVAGNLRSRFKFSESALERLFSGQMVVLKSDLDKTTADRYARGLWQAGARCRVEPVTGSSPIEAVKLGTSSDAEPSTMNCPNCAEEQPEGLTCRACGVVVEKFRRRREEAAIAEWGGPGSGRSVGMGRVTGGVTSALAGTKPWVQIVAVLMFIGSILGLAAAFLALLIGRRHGLPISKVHLLIQVPLLLLYLVPAFLLFQYGQSIGTFLEEEKVVALERALERQRSFWKFVGILSMTAIFLTVLGIACAILLPLVARGG